MKTKILAACSIAALAVPFHASAKELPTWSPSAICAADSARDHCEFLEGQARRDISEQWPFIPALVREQCLKSNADQDSESWRIFGDCLADAARGEQVAAATASGDGASDDADNNAGAAAADTAALDAANAKIAELEAALASSQTAGRRNETRIEGLQERLAAATAAAAATAVAATATAAATMAPSDDAGDHEAALGKLEARAKAAEFRSKQLQAALVETIELRKADKAAMMSAGDTGESDAQIATLEAALAASDAKVETSSERITNLQERLIRARENTASAEASLATSDANLDKANARIRGLQDRMIADRKNAAETTNSRIAELEASLKGAESKVSLGNARIEGLQERLLAAVDAAENAPPADGADNSADEERIAELETSLAAAQSQVKLGNARIEGLQARLIEASEAESAADTGGAGAARLQTLLDNQRERATRVAAIVAKQRDELDALRGEVRDLRRGASRNVVADCQQRMSDIVSTSGINFGNDSAEITAEAAGVLRRISATASLCEDAQITVRGHTDSRGDPVYNQQLSERRARAVARFLGREGVAPARISAVGVGQDEPTASNDTRAGRAQNRRIEFVVQ